MDKILVAGATGYLGQHVVRELKKRGYWVRVLIRDEKQKEKFKNLSIDDFFIGEITKPETITNICKNIDVVFSSVGITRQKDGLEYMDVDFQGNYNLLLEAKISNVKLFQYISAIDGDKHRNLKIFEAKEKFVDKLKYSGLDYTITRPSGFFSDMRDFLDMAKGGRVYLFGSGLNLLNPIAGEDLAIECVNLIENPKKEVLIGGPDILTQKDIGEYALKAWGKAVKIVLLPDWIRKLAIRSVRLFTSSKTYGPIEFFLTVMAYDNIGEVHGTKHLEEFFIEEVKRVQ